MPAFEPVRPASGKLRVAIIGAGDISQYHLAAWRKLAHAEVVAVCDRDENRARACAAAFSIPGVHADAATMFARERLDAVDIATWRETHVELTRLAAAHGVHVLCQKPLAPTLADATAVAAEVAGRVRLMVHENRRFAPHFRAIRRWIDEGRVGPVRQCVMTMHRSGFITERVPVDYKAAYQICFDAGIAHFVEQLLTGQPFETAPDDNLQTLKLVEDAYALAAHSRVAPIVEDYETGRQPSSLALSARED